MSAPLDAIFQTKYEEFGAALLEVFPELEEVIKSALSASPTDRVSLFKQLVLPSAGNSKRDPTTFPGMVLPGVYINEATWASSSEGTKTAINQFIKLLCFTFVMKEGGSDEFGGEAFRTFADKFMNDWRGKMDRNEFDSFAKRFADLFGSGENRLPPFPERLRKGKLVRLAEEIVKELKPEEFGLDPDTVRQCEADPSKAFEILMQTTMRNPARLQDAMKRIIKRLQEKFQRGEFKPQELAAEAEEMMKEFSENPAFVDMMDQMRKVFSFEDMASAKAAGQEQSARMAMVKERLRRKAAENAAAKAAAKPSATAASAATAAAVAAANAAAAELEVDEFVSILVNGGKKGKGKGKK
jgi:hypothetical protein